MFAHVMILNRSFQPSSLLLAPSLRTSSALIAASRIMSHPLASQAAGTVSHTSALSEYDKRGQGDTLIWQGNSRIGFSFGEGAGALGIYHILNRATH